MKELEIFEPVRELTVGGEKVDVRELRWKQGLEFMDKLARHIGQFVTPDRRLALSVETVGGAVKGSSELVEYLVTHSTGKDAAWLDNLKMSDALDVIDAAVSMNIHPDFFVKAARTANRVKAALGLKSGTPNGPESSPSSSGQDTAGQK